MSRRVVTIDGNEAAAFVAHKTNEVIAIYPITPSTAMGEHADAFSASGRTNIWGTVPLVIEMQSEGGAAGACHGALQTGALTTTFTASQGLLLMIPNMYKIAGELSPAVFHVSARTVATHALSIFGDHSDVMAVRQTGWAMLASASVQEVMDMALIAQAATLQARVPVVHFFDGWRTSNEIQKVEQLADDDIRAMLDDELVAAHRARALSPNHPVLRGTAQNPDVFFQAREACNPYYLACPDIVQNAMDKFADITGRGYKLFDYVGAPDAERVVVLMASGAEVAHEAVDALVGQGEKVGLLKVRLFRPFSVKHLLEALPPTVRTIAALDRTKEPGCVGEPLYQDIVTALVEAGATRFETLPKVIGGRYGLSSKEFTPAMVKGVLDELAKGQPKNHFTVGINDDVTHTSIAYDPAFTTRTEGAVQAMFYGLGSDGTVSANKNSVKIIGENTGNHAQGYFVYDSRKAGSITTSHLRFGPDTIRSPYLIDRADFVACHQSVFIERYDMLRHLVEGGTFLLNSPDPPAETWDKLPYTMQQQVITKKLKLYVIDAYEVARLTGMGVRINTIMQTCFFAISGILPKDQAIEQIKKAIKKTFGRKGEEVVQKNYNAVDQALAHLQQVDVPAEATSQIARPAAVSQEAPPFVREFTATVMQGLGDTLPVSKMPVDGTFPTGTTQWEKRNVALEIPVWDPDVCIQCGKCSLVCPHATIRMKVYDPALLNGQTPETFKSAEAKGKEFKGLKFTIQVAPEDCTGCGACTHVCPAKNKTEPNKKAINLAPQPPLRESERANWDFFLTLPDYDRTQLKTHTVKGSQLLQPLFEFSGCCSGCGETPYVKLVSQLFGDRAIIANATGCSSIYGGNLPTTPYTTNAAGLGPAWSNSLFEDNAEFGFGFRLTSDKAAEFARELVGGLAGKIGPDLASGLLEADQSTEAGIAAQRQRVAQLMAALEKSDDPKASQLKSLAEFLVKRSVWIFGGDGWAYDIGYGGLDHVLANRFDVNVLVLDTEVYSNTGGQMSKSTPRAAVAKFAAGGKSLARKDLGMMLMSYGHVYVAQVAMGANDSHTVKALLEAESFDGPSIVLAYSTCIGQGINMRTGMDNQKAAVASGHYPLYRFDPRRADQGNNPLQLDSKPPSISFKEFAYKETRFSMLAKANPDEAKRLIELAQADTDARWRLYEQMANLKYGAEAETAETED